MFVFESINSGGLERLWEFDIRKLVFLGIEQFIDESKLKAISIIEELIKYLDLDAKIQTVTDPFFATVSNARKLWQKSLEVKFELKLPIAYEDGVEKNVVAGSINSHGTFFAERYDIPAEGECAKSSASI